MRPRARTLALVFAIFFPMFASVPARGQSPATASFLKADSTTQGNWHGTYGADGFSVAQDSQSLPSYSSFSIQGQQDYTWAASTTDGRGLQTGNGTGRIAAAWYNASSFSFDVNFADGNPHQVELYAVDWDNAGRSGTVQILDAASQAVLDTQSLSSFANGVYLVWNISGHVTINVIQTNGPNAVISGVFFGGSSAITSSASFLRTDAVTQGNWHGAYGAEGYAVANDSQSVPSYAAFTVQNQASWTWAASSSDSRALQTGDGSGRLAAAWYNSPVLNLDVNVTDASPHQLALYAVDWDNSGRSETIQILDGATAAVLDTRSLASFSGGAYLVWNIAGHIRINVTQSAGANSVISGVFFGGSSAISSTATFLRFDTTTEGNWRGSYGADGYSVANDSQSVPSYASFVLQNQSNYTWAQSTGDVRALQTGGGTGGIASAWYSASSFSFDINITVGQTHQVAIYALDWDGLGRIESVQVLDAATEAILDTRSLSNFTNGIYAIWNISGHVRINVIGTSGTNAVASGAFFGGGTAITSAATFVAMDGTTQGNWHGAYGKDGYVITNDSQSLPSYATFAVQNQANWTWAATSADTRALQTGDGTSRLAATWYNNPEFSLDVNLTDGNTHQFSLYAVDWDNQGRSESVQILDAATQAVLDTRSISNFTNGFYLVWNITGHVRINVIQSAGPNAVISGAFWDPGPAGGGPALVSIAISPGSPSLSVGGTQQLSATGTYSDNTTKDITSSASWSSWNSSIVSVSNTPPTPGLVTALNPGTTNVIATVGTIGGTATVTSVGAALPSPPNIVGVSPLIAAAGTQVTVTGSGFGASQGQGYVIVGSALGTVISWSDSQIVAAVAPGSTTGSVQVVQAGQQSNSIDITISNPTITDVSPPSGAPGTTITISGSGFGAAQGNGQVWLGNMNGVVSSWSDSQVVAAVATGASSGKAQILQNGVWSNAVPFNAGIPQITGISPNSGPGGTAVTISGSGFGAAQGSGQVWIGNMFATVMSWSDGQVVATVAANALTGVIRIQQNGTWSNSLAFTVPPSDGSSTLTLAPTSITMLVGDTHAIMATNAQGQSVTGLAWSSSDNTIVSLSTDDPPILTAVAAGRATITAGNASADVTVYAGTSLPIGTVQWSNPGDGSGVYQIVPAVPSNSGVDVFAFNASGTVSAITADGTTAWTANINDNSAVPDFLGGLVVLGNPVQELDPMTGQPNPGYTSVSGENLYNVAPHTDGTIFVVDGDQVVGVDPASGAAKFSVQMDDSTYDVTDTNEVFCYDSPLPQSGGSGTSYPPQVGRLMIAGDGFAYLPYLYTDTFGLYTGWCEGSKSTTQHLRLLRVDSSGNFTKLTLGDWGTNTVASAILSPCCVYSTEQTSPVPTIYWSNPITNADTGVLFSWEADVPAFCAFSGTTGQFGCAGESSTFHLATTVGTAVASNVTVNLPGQTFPIQPVLQAVDGSYIGAVDTQAGQFMIAFDTSGNVRWSVPNYSPQMATADGSVIAQSADGLTTVAVDASGVVTGQFASFLAQTWLGNAYEYGPVEQIASPPLIAGSLWAFLGGGPSGGGTAGRPWYFILNWQNEFDFIPDLPSILPNLKQEITNQATTIKLAALDALKKAYRPWLPVVIVEGTPNTGDHQAIVQTSSTGMACGDTNPNQTKSSTIYYECVMEQAQQALQVVINNASDESNALNRQDLITAIGRGIGNTAAHEIAHQFLGKCCSMDALTSQDPNAAATYNNGSANGSPDPQSPDSEPATYTGYGKDGKTQIHWESSTHRALTECLNAGWRDFGIVSCAVKLELSQNRVLRGPGAGVWAKGYTPAKPPLCPKFSTRPPLPGLPTETH